MSKIFQSLVLYKIIGNGKTFVNDRLNPEHPKYDPDFPKPFKMANSVTNYWVESEVLAWIELQIEKGRANQDKSREISKKIKDRLQGGRGAVA